MINYIIWCCLAWRLGTAQRVDFKMWCFFLVGKMGGIGYGYPFFVWGNGASGSLQGYQPQWVGGN